MNRFIIIRHGQTKGTEMQRYYGKTDMPLSKSGISQIEGLKKKIKKYSIDYIYSSPLKRCIETARILKQKKSTPIEISEDIAEIDFGNWEGLTLSQMEKNNPKKFYNWLNDFANFRMPDGESVRNIIKRVERFWRYVKQRHYGKNILISTHGGPAKVIIMKALGLPMRNFWRLEIRTGSVCVIESFEDIDVVKAINLWGKLP